MKAAKATSSSRSSDKLQRRVSELEKEIKTLNIQLSREKAKKSPLGVMKEFFRNTAIVLLVLLTAFSLNLGAAAVWLERTLINTDTWVDKTSAIIQDPNVRTDISNSIASEIFAKGDVETYIKQVLPPQIDGLSAPLTSSLEQATAKRVNKVIQSDAFIEFWEKASRSAHSGIMESLENRGAQTSDVQDNLLYIQDDQLLLNLKPVFGAVQTRLSDAGLKFVNRVDVSKINRTVELTELKNMQAILRAYNAVQKLAIALPLLAIAAAVGALALARSKRKVLMSIGVVTALLMVLNVQLVYFVQYPVVNAIAKSLASSSTASGQAIFTILTEDLIAMNRVLMALALLVVLGAFLSGPSGSAKWLRLKAGSLVTMKNSNAPAVKWTATHAYQVVAGVCVATLGLLVFPLMQGPTYPVVIVSSAVVIAFVVLSVRQASES